MDVLDKSKIEEDILKNKAELIKLEVYIKKLQAFKLERELGLQQSTFIKDLAVENQVEMAACVHDLKNNVQTSSDSGSEYYTQKSNKDGSEINAQTARDNGPELAESTVAGYKPRVQEPVDYFQLYECNDERMEPMSFSVTNVCWPGPRIKNRNIPLSLD